MRSTQQSRLDLAARRAKRDVKYDQEYLRLSRARVRARLTNPELVGDRRVASLLVPVQAAIDEKTAVVWVCSPNNPTGNYINESALLSFLKRCLKMYWLSLMKLIMNMLQQRITAIHWI